MDSGMMTIVADLLQRSALKEQVGIVTNAGAGNQIVHDFISVPLLFSSADWGMLPQRWHWWCHFCSYVALHCGFLVGTNVTFVINTTAMTWSQAQSYCRQHHTDLASVENMSENLRIKELLSTGYIVWIGLFRDPFWKWVDGATFSFYYWGTAQPAVRQFCVAATLNDSGKWQNWDCDLRMSFICYDGKLWLNSS